MVALSVVGTERLLASGFWSGEPDQSSSIPNNYPRDAVLRIVKALRISPPRATKYACQLPLIQPMAADDVASAVGRIATARPVNGIVALQSRLFLSLFPTKIPVFRVLPSAPRLILSAVTDPESSSGSL